MRYVCWINAVFSASLGHNFSICITQSGLDRTGFILKRKKRTGTENRAKKSLKTDAKREKPNLQDRPVGSVNQTCRTGSALLSINIVSFIQAVRKMNLVAKGVNAFHARSDVTAFWTAPMAEAMKCYVVGLWVGCR